MSSRDEYSTSETARAWLIKMRSEDADMLRDEFDAWLAASPDHRDAYDRIARGLKASAILKASRRHGTAHSDARQPSRSKGWIAWGTVAMAAALLLIAYGAGGATLTGPLRFGSGTALAAEPLVTRRGEIRSFRLADGSTATLDTNSRLEVSISAGERRVRLARGRARLSVAADPRPFQARAGTGVVDIREGEFDIGIDESGEVSVMLLRGEAGIRPLHPIESSPMTTRPLLAGRQLAYRSGAAIPTLSEAPADMTAREWPDGWAEYRTVPVGGLIAEANRYAGSPIIIDDIKIAQLEISGRFKISETGALAGRIASLFDLVAVKQADGIHLRQR